MSDNTMADSSNETMTNQTKIDVRNKSKSKKYIQEENRNEHINNNMQVLEDNVVINK